MAPDRPDDVAICDAGPLIHLDELACLDLLSDWRVWIPDAVWREIEGHHPNVLTLVNVERQVGPRPISAALSAFTQSLSLDSGELEALALMSVEPQAIFLTDDAAARLTAQQLGYDVHGTIGVLLRAIRRGQRTAAEVVVILKSIPRESSLHIRSNLLLDVIADVQRKHSLA